MRLYGKSRSWLRCQMVLELDNNESLELAYTGRQFGFERIYSGGKLFSKGHTYLTNTPRFSFEVNGQSGTIVVYNSLFGMTQSCELIHDQTDKSDETAELNLPAKHILNQISVRLLKEITMQSTHVLQIRITDELAPSSIDLFMEEADEEPLEFHRYAFCVVEKLQSAGEIFRTNQLVLDKPDRQLEIDADYLLFFNQIEAESQLAHHFGIKGICKATREHLKIVRDTINA